MGGRKRWLRNTGQNLGMKKPMLVKARALGGVLRPVLAPPSLSGGAGVPVSGVFHLAGISVPFGSCRAAIDTHGKVAVPLNDARRGTERAGQGRALGKWIGSLMLSSCVGGGAQTNIARLSVSSS